MLRYLMLILLLILSSINVPASYADIPSGYDIVQTRVIEDGIILHEPDTISTVTWGSALKINMSFQIWNPSDQDVQLDFERGYPMFMLYSNNSFEKLLDHEVPEEYQDGSPNKMQLRPGLTTLNHAVQMSWDLDYHSPLNEGYQEFNIKYYNVHTGLPTLTSYPVLVQVNHSLTGPITASSVPEEWGNVSSAYLGLYVTITHLELHLITYTTRASFTLEFQGEYWNPTNSTVGTTSASDCYDRNMITRKFTVSSDLYFSGPPHLCHSTMMFYELESGVHRWHEFGVGFSIYNSNSTQLPDGSYTFYFHIFQDPSLVHYAYLIAENGTYSYAFDDYPVEWKLINSFSSVPPSTSNPSDSNRTTDMSSISLIDHPIFMVIPILTVYIFYRKKLLFPRMEDDIHKGVPDS